MILRRFMKHVTDQNWFAVGLDVIVVITGIFLGMQVTEWNDDRKDKIKEKVIIENLIEDFKVIDSQIKTMAYRAATNIHTFSIVLKALDSGAVPKEEEIDFKFGLTSLMSSLPPPQNSGTIEELIATGGLAQLSDDILRQRIFSFQSEMDLVASQMVKFENVLQMYGTRNVEKMCFKFEGGVGAKMLAEKMPGNNALDELARLSIEDFDFWSDNWVETYDITAMAKDPMTHKTFSQSRMLNMGTAFWAKRLYERSLAVQQRLLELKGGET